MTKIKISTLQRKFPSLYVTKINRKFDKNPPAWLTSQNVMSIYIIFTYCLDSGVPLQTVPRNSNTGVISGFI